MPEVDRVREFADAYLADEPQHLERLRAMTGDPAGAAPYVRAVPEFLRRERYQSALTILRAVEVWSGKGLPYAADFERLLEDARAAVGETDLLRTLVERFRGGSAEIRQKVVEVLAALGRHGASPLIDLLTAGGDTDLRPHLIRALTQIRATAIWEIRAALERPDLPAQVICDLLAVLAQNRSLEARNTVERFLTHHEAGVREQALAAHAQISGRHAELELVAALTDPVARVRRRALLCLGRLENSNPRLVNVLCEAVGRWPFGQAAKDEQFRIQVCQALAEMGRRAASVVPQIEAALLRALEHAGGRESSDRWGGAAGKNDPLRGAICTALGQIGTAAAAASLGRMLQEESLLVRDRAVRALRQLEERLALQAA